VDIPLVNYGAVVIKYDDAGNLLWQNLDADGSGLALLALAPMKLDANNNAYLGRKHNVANGNLQGK
jgi:hypothetical protein